MITEIKPIKGEADYAAALQDDAQQVLNSWLRSEIEEVGLSKLFYNDTAPT